VNSWQLLHTDDPVVMYKVKLGARQIIIKWKDDRPFDTSNKHKQKTKITIFCFSIFMQD